MSVTAVFVSVPAELLPTLERHPALARALGDDDRIEDLADDVGLDPQLVTTLRGCARSGSLDLDKAWDAARRVLHGARGFRKNPADAFEVGKHHPDENVSVLSVRNVARVAKLLAQVPDSTLRARGCRAHLDAEPPYPFSVGVATEEVLDYAVAAIESLRRFFERAASQGHGAVRWIE